MATSVASPDAGLFGHLSLSFQSRTVQHGSPKPHVVTEPLKCANLAVVSVDHTAEFKDLVVVGRGERTVLNILILILTKS